MFWNRLVPRTGAADELEWLNNDPEILKTPASSAFLASVIHTLSEEMGFRRSAESNSGEAGNGSPVPLLSYSFIEYVDGLDLSGFDLLEIGGGSSTAFWATRCRSVTVLETNPEWAKAVAAKSPQAEVEVVATEQLASRIAAFDRAFDIIVIDPAGNRRACARAAAAKLAPGGFAVLDNSDWYPNASAELRAAGLIEIDFHDFRPVRHFRSTTSMYLEPAFRPKPKQDRLPLTPIGGKKVSGNRWDL